MNKALLNFKRLPLRLAAVVAFSGLASPMFAEPVTVSANVTKSGAIYTYNYTISETLSPVNSDVFLLDISVPAAAGSVFGLMAPAGFKTAFDSGLGLASFLEDTGSFGATPISGFSFNSNYAPGSAGFQASVLSYSDFSISTVNGTTLAPNGVTLPVNPTPEPSTLMLMATGGSALELLRRLKARKAKTN